MTGSPFRPLMTLHEAQSVLRTLVDEGAACPCCTQFAKVYKRRINSTMARALISLYRQATPGEFVHAPSLPGDTHEMSQLVWWHLIDEESARRPDGGRAGWWAITPRGCAYVRRELTLPKHARIYDGRCLGLTGVPVKITDSLGAKFDYEELMRS